MGRAKQYRKGTGLLAEVAVSNISHRSDTLESLSRRTEILGQPSCLVIPWSSTLNSSSLRLVTQILQAAQRGQMALGYFGLYLK